ncbi:MAG: ferritin-like domain-containing protein [Vitreoscilla sp.]|nr:ferritin-like domain-containing protein [Vitreoscilla sp.]
MRAEALKVLCVAEPESKARQARELLAASRGGASIDPQVVLVPDSPLPGRPARPALVTAIQVPRRSPFTTAGRAALLHAICHIEFNAINLALDATWRFAGMPEAFYRDWLQVAGEEALHFTLLREHLQRLGHDYGDFDAHDGLWSMAEKTKDDIVARIALVPRTLEARGLDATPPLQAKLRKAGDLRAVEILDVILRDEIGHVAIGNRWYAWLCRREGLEPISTYAELTLKYQAPRLRAPFNLSAREAAGFTPEELARL